MNHLAVLLLLQMSMMSVPQPPDMTKEHYLLVTSHAVPCGECNFTYAVACTDGNPSCGQPMKELYEYHPFETKEDALNFMNSPLGLIDNGYQEDFVGLYSLSGIHVDISKTKEWVKQPSIETTKIHYSLGSKP
jgi:hypothetical protein